MKRLGWDLRVPEDPEQIPNVEQEPKKVDVSRIGLGASAWLGIASY